MTKKSPEPEGVKVVATNRKARRDFFVLESYEAGLELHGSEVKALRSGQIELDGSWADVRGSQLTLRGLYIKPYAFATMDVPDPKRVRRLLMHKNEIQRLGGKLSDKSVKLIPLRLYFKRGWAKLELGLVKHKKAPDKRADIKKKDLSREMDRSFRGKFKL